MGITRVIAAHRPETLASADRVVGLQDGRLVPVKFELRAVSAGATAEPAKPRKDHYTDGIGLKRDSFET